MLKIKRTISLLLCAAMLVCICACNGKKENTASENTLSETTDDVEDDEFVLDDIDGTSKTNDNTSKTNGSTAKTNDSKAKSERAKKFPNRATDLKGKTITIHVWQDYVTGSDTTKPLLAKNQKTLNAKIEKQLNCKLKFVKDYQNTETGQPAMLAAVASGKPNVDIWWIGPTAFCNAYSSGYLVELNSLDAIDTKDRTHFTQATDLCTFGNKCYGIGPITYGIMPVFTSNVLWVNVDLLANCGVSIDELKKAQNGGNWNWKQFRKICEKVKANNGKNGYNTFSIVDNDLTFYQTLMNANNTDWISRDKKGGYSFAGGDNKGQNVLNYYSKLVKDGLVGYNSNEGGSFDQGKTAFVAAPMFLPIYRTWNFEYTCMYPPKGDDAKDYSVATDSYTFAVIPKGQKPSGCSDAEIATVLDMINTPLITSKEDSSMAATDMAIYMRNSLAQDTIMGIYKSNKTGIVWGCMTDKIGLNSTTNGWYSKVKKIATSGGQNMSKVIREVSNSYNAKLKSLWSK